MAFLSQWRAERDLQRKAAGYVTALRIATVVCAVGGVFAAVLVRETAPTTVPPHPSAFAACQDAGVAVGSTSGEQTR